MGFISFNKRIKHRSFDYTPRFYDPDKEALEERLELYDQDDQSIDQTKKRIKNGLKSKYRGDGSYRKSQTQKSNIRLVMIIGILVLLSYLFLQSQGILNFIESISNG